MLELINKNLQLEMLPLGERFQKNTPFPHLVLDQFFRPDFAQRLLDAFPSFDPQKAMNELGVVGGKAVHQNIRELAQPYKDLDELVQSEDFLKFTSGITRIPDLIYDPDYVGGGTHENLHGQELDPHADFNYHPAYKWHRRLNLLIYLNPEWEEDWGGSIELHSDPWNPEGNEVKSSLPIMNRCLIFETSEQSWHGFKRIKLPDNQRGLSRKSIAFYFYTKERPQSEIRPEHGTFYVPRQPSEHIQAGYTLTDSDVNELKTLLARRDSWVKFLYERELKFSSELGEKNSRIQQLSDSLSERMGRDERLRRAEELEREVMTQRGFIARLQNEFDDRGRWAMDLDREVNNLRAMVSGLETKVRELERLDADLNSRAFLLK